MEKIKVGIWSDAVVPTGWSRVMHSIIGRLSPDEYDIFWIGINYYGDPHPYPYRIFPASAGTPGDIYGLTRFQSILQKEKPDIIFLLNDAWIMTDALAVIRGIYEGQERPKIVAYFPIDAEDHDEEWYKNFDIVDEIVCYNEFGRSVASKCLPNREIKVIFHGVDTELFKPIAPTRADVKKILFPSITDVENSFVVLNANRNQPRKRLDLTLQGFAKFAEGKPDNVKLYMHCGVKDAHIDIIKLTKRYNITERLFLTSAGVGVQQVSDASLNKIYNACDVGINTSTGEGWGLVACEHGATGAAQIVPGFSACKELFEDCGVLLENGEPYVLTNICTTGYLVTADEVANKLEYLYTNRDAMEQLGKACIEKFNRPEYSWNYIATQWDALFKGLMQ